MQPAKDTKDDSQFGKIISEKEKRKLRALRQNNGSVWNGLGMFGMIGWSVVVPTLLGAALGIWLDKIYHQPFSWTITCLMIGLFSGCVIAWYWVDKEGKDIHQNENDDGE
jgi:ATP synthase protein I